MLCFCGLYYPVQPYLLIHPQPRSLHLGKESVEAHLCESEIAAHSHARQDLEVVTLVPGIVLLKSQLKHCMMVDIHRAESLERGQIENLCGTGDPTTTASTIPDSRFEAITKELENSLHSASWSSRPRTYFILWQIKRIDAMESFIAKGLNDTSLPYSGRPSLPETLNYHEAADFLRWQHQVFTDVLHLEHGKHVRIGNGDTLFEAGRLQLGVGSQGCV